MPQFSDGSSRRAPGSVLDYVEKTSDTSVTATSDGSADSVITGNSVVYDGVTQVRVEAFIPGTVPAGSQDLNAVLLRDSTVLGRFRIGRDLDRGGWVGVRYDTPSAGAHTYSLKAITGGSTGTVSGGAGGSGNNLPAFLRVTVA